MPKPDGPLPVSPDPASPPPPKSGTGGVLFSVLVLALLLLIVSLQFWGGPAAGGAPAPSTGPATAPATQPVVAWVDTLYTKASPFNNLLKGTINVVFAGLVGYLGATAYYVGVLTGFIDRTARDAVLLHLLNDTTRTPLVRRIRLRLWYFAFGGVVAAIFQSAQADTFAPIQAFVLGITWPSVVSRSMSSASEARTVDDLLRSNDKGGGGPPGGPAPKPDGQKPAPPGTPSSSSSSSSSYNASEIVIAPPTPANKTDGSKQGG